MQSSYFQTKPELVFVEPRESWSPQREIFRSRGPEIGWPIVTSWLTKVETARLVLIGCQSGWATVKFCSGGSLVSIASDWPFADWRQKCFLLPRFSQRLELIEDRVGSPPGLCTGAQNSVCTLKVLSLRTLQRGTTLACSVPFTSLYPFPHFRKSLMDCRGHGCGYDAQYKGRD